MNINSKNNQWKNWNEDNDVRAIFDWFIDIIGMDDWILRKTLISAHLNSILSLKEFQVPLLSNSTRILFDEDKFGWYLYLAEAYLTHIEDYEFSQGARIIPILKALGREIDLLKIIEGVDDRVRKIATSERNNPDGGLFELLVALAYKKNGWDKVIFIQEAPPLKTPDIYVKRNESEWFIECKRMSKSSEYSIKERQKWLKLWVPLDNYLLSNKRSLILDITFHVELHSLDDSFLEIELIPKLRFVWSPGTVVDNEIWKVTVNFVDYNKINKVMAETDIKSPSSSLTELITGSYDPSKGFTSIMKCMSSTLHISYLDKIDFVAGSLWKCDAKAAIDKKARDIRRHLAEAIQQLPNNKPGIIHIALESHDGGMVEEERYKKITNTVFRFNNKRNNLQWIYIHIFDPRVPPDDNWDFGETIHYFSHKKAIKEPLNKRTVVVPEES